MDKENKQIIEELNNEIQDETVNGRIEEQLAQEKIEREERIQQAKSSQENKITGFLEIPADKDFGFIRNENYLTSPDDIYVSQSQIFKFKLKTGDFITGYKREPKATERFGSLMFIEAINGFKPDIIKTRKPFESFTPIFPTERIHLETNRETLSTRMIDLLAPIGKGQRGIIVSPPKAGKTTLLKTIANAITQNHPEVYLLIVLIDERPEEVTDFKEAIHGDKVEVLYSTFDELPVRHKKVSEMVLERAKRLVESKQDVVILLDSITRLARAFNLLETPSGRTLSGGLDPNALYFPKKFFGAARNVREGGSLTIIGTALVDTGSKMDDVIYEEFKGTGNMELVLSRAMQERRIFPAIDIAKSGTRREELMLTEEELTVSNLLHRVLNNSRSDQALDNVFTYFKNSPTNEKLVANILKRTQKSTEEE